MAAKKKKASKKVGRRKEPNSKSGRIRSLLSSGMSAKEIATKVGCTVQLVYNIKSAGSGKAKGRKKKAGSTAMPSDLAGILEAVKNSERERQQMRSALERIQAVIRDALAD